MSTLHEAARRVVAAWVSTRPAWIEQCNAAVLALDAALKTQPDPVQEPFSPLRDLLTQAAAVAVAAERAGKYEGASWVADAVLAQEQPGPAQEPVAWMVEGSLYASKEVAQKMGGNAYTLQALYTTPQPQRPPLTEEEIWEVYYNLPESDFEGSNRVAFARAIERKVRGE